MFTNIIKQKINKYEYIALQLFMSAVLTFFFIIDYGKTAFQCYDICIQSETVARKSKTLTMLFLPFPYLVGLRYY